MKQSISLVLAIYFLVFLFVGILVPYPAVSVTAIFLCRVIVVWIFLSTITQLKLTQINGENRQILAASLEVFIQIAGLLTLSYSR
jgi:hypothetical protein